MVKRKSINHHENHIIHKLDMERSVGPDMVQLVKLTSDKKFLKNLKMQDEASMLWRGLHFKFQSLMAKAAVKDKDYDEALRIVKSMSNRFGAMYDKKEGRSDLPGTGENPFNVKVSFVVGEKDKEE